MRCVLHARWSTFAACFAAALAPVCVQAQYNAPPPGHSTGHEWRSVTPAQATAPTQPPPVDVLPPREPTRVAQYPLENDPYEGPPVSPQAPAYSETRQAPATSSPTWSAEPQSDSWITLDSTQISAAYLHDTSEGLGVSDIVGKTTIKFPHAPFIWASPQVGAHYFTDAGMPNVPSETYDVSLEIVFGFPINDRWIFQGAISPGIFSDFQVSGGDEFRLPYRGLFFYKWSDTLTLGGGFLVLDRPDVSALPLIGLSYIPSDDFRCEIWFPRAKVSRRYWNRDDLERWIYAAAEFGGGSWAIERDNGQSDNFAYRDYRLMFGVEQKCPHGLGWFVEGGIMFGRQVSFERTDTDIDLDQTAGMQAGVRF